MFIYTNIPIWDAGILNSGAKMPAPIFLFAAEKNYVIFNISRAQIEEACHFYVEECRASLLDKYRQ